MVDLPRDELDAAVRAYVDAHEALLAAGRAYFGQSSPPIVIRDAWREAVLRAAEASQALRSFEERFDREARQYIRTALRQRAPA